MAATVQEALAAVPEQDERDREIRGALARQLVEGKHITAMEKIDADLGISGMPFVDPSDAR